MGLKRLITREPHRRTLGTCEMCGVRGVPLHEHHHPIAEVSDWEGLDICPVCHYFHHRKRGDRGFGLLKYGAVEVLEWFPEKYPNFVVDVSFLSDKQREILSARCGELQKRISELRKELKSLTRERDKISKTLRKGYNWYQIREKTNEEIIQEEIDKMNWFLTQEIVEGMLNG